MASKDGNPEELRIVLAGDSGSGKSATGNTILRKRAFTIQRSWVPTTLTCQMERGVFEGTPVSVVDTPWSIRPNTIEMSKCISYCAPGPHAFLLVIPLKQLHEVEQQVLHLQQTFGEEASRYTIVLFTRGDEPADRVSAEQFSRQNLPYHVGYHVFNNRSEDPSQVRELLEKINAIVQRNGGHYSIKVKDRKHEFLYLLASAVTIGGAIGAESGGTAGGVGVAVVGSIVGAYAADVGGNRGVAVAIALAVALAVAVPVVGAVVLAAVYPVVVAVAGTGFFSTSVASVVSVVTTYAAAAVLGYAGGVTGVVPGAKAVAGAVGVAGAVLVAVNRDVSAVALAGAEVSFITIGAGIAGKATAAIIAGAGTAGSPLEAIFGICGAAVGAGVAVAVGGYAENDLIHAQLFAFVGLLFVLCSLFIIICEAGSAIDKIVALAIITGMSAGAAFGAAVGVLGESGFAAGAVIYLVCLVVAWWSRG